MYTSKILFLVFSAILVASSATNLDEFSAEQLIIQGHDAVRGQFPFYAYLDVKSSTEFATCGGSLISNQWIVTAGHCIEDAKRVTVYLGSLRAEDRNEEDRKTITVTDGFHVHPNFSTSITINACV